MVRGRGLGTEGLGTVRVLVRRITAVQGPSFKVRKLLGPCLESWARVDLDLKV